MKYLPVILFAGLTTLWGCKKKSEDTPVTYMPSSANSTWTFDTRTYAPAPATGSYTLTATSRDTLINSRSYRVYTNSKGQNDYYAQVGSDYYQYGSIAALSSQRAEVLYLKDAAAGTTWSENQSVTLTGFPLPVNIPVNYRVVKKGFDTTVNGRAYTDVTHVQVSLGSFSVLGTTITPVTNIPFYYARGIGRIYNRTRVTANATILGNTLNVNIDEELLLKTHTIR